MKPKYAWQILSVLTALLLVFGLLPQAATAAPASDVTFTILHHNDFHGQLEPSGSNPGLARLANAVNVVKTAVGADNLLVMDVGDEMQGSLLSNIWQGEPVIDAYNTIGYDAATFGNHEFDWGKDVLSTRVGEALYPYVSANIVLNDTGNCATAGWGKPAFVDAPYEIITVGSPVSVKVAVIGVTSPETPTITIAEATEGLCFKDAAESIIHHYDAMKAAGADVIVVLSHLGFEDGGYGYGIPVYGDKTLAKKLNTAGKHVDLILGGHSHTDLAAATVEGGTTIAQAHYNGRKLGRANITVKTDGTVQVVWSRITISTTGAEDATIKALVAEYATDPDYMSLINQPVGYSQTDLLRDYNGDNMMGDFVDDAIYSYLNSDTDPTNDVDMFFNNAGGIRIDWCDKEDPANPGSYIWTSAAADCQKEGLWTHDPMLLTYGQMFQILPFGNATIVGDMTGAQIVELLNQSATLFKGAIQPAGMRYSFFRYSDALPGPQPYAWGAYDYCVINKVSGVCEPFDLSKTYRVGTNEFLAPAGQDGYTPFKYMTNVSYWGDMLNAVNAYVAANHGTPATAYKGPDGDGTLDGRITRNGTDSFTGAAGQIVPLTILHHNDSHGNLVKTSYVGYTQLATLIKQERAHNPGRTLLLSSGDNIQGDAMSYYFRTAGLGYAADGTALAPELQEVPLIKAFNLMGYDAMTLGNHEFNFGKDVFTSALSAANFPILQANVKDTGEYGLASVPVQDYVEKDLGDIDVAILGIGNHRIPNYELPSNIPGLTFTDPIAKTQELADLLNPTNDVVIALTHIGFTEDPKSVEVDANVDTNLAMVTSGVDAIIGGHSHTDPSKGFGLYKYLPTIIENADGEPVIINQAYRYNNYLGEVVLGLRSTGSGNYDVVSETGRYIAVSKDSTPEDAVVKAAMDPYVTLQNAYNNTVIGQTTVPIDALQAYTQETTGANLQADAGVYVLEKNGIDVDFHLSGAMSNRKVADAATPATPVDLKISDMFTLMPYENSLVVIRMNGPQLKAVLERAYRNYFYYKYVPGYGGYSYYTTCMLDTNFGNVITYNDVTAATYDPTRSYVVSLNIGGHDVDFFDADTYYNVSTVNYLAAGSCNFNNAGVSLWPLDQIVADTQYYVRDAVIEYVKNEGTVSPAIEGRLAFVNIADSAAPTITINSPVAMEYTLLEPLTLDFSAVDVGIAGLFKVEARLDGKEVADGQEFNLLTLPAGPHTLTVYAVDNAGNASSKSVTFTVFTTSFQSKFTTGAKGWTPVRGTWTITDTGYYKTKGVVNEIASTIHKTDFGMLTLEARMRRKLGEASLPNRLHFRTSPAGLDASGQWTNGYIFQYTNAGYFSVWKVVDGVFSPVVGWTYSPTIVPFGWNTLKVVANGENMEFYINGVLHAAGSDSAHSIGRVALSMWRATVKAPFIVDWVKVSNIATPATYVDAVTSVIGTPVDWADPNSSPE